MTLTGGWDSSDQEGADIVASYAEGIDEWDKSQYTRHKKLKASSKVWNPIMTSTTNSPTNAIIPDDTISLFEKLSSEVKELRELVFKKDESCITKEIEK